MKNVQELEASRYRWLRDNKHLDAWWSVQGPKNRAENIDADIDAAMMESEIKPSTSIPPICHKHG